MSSFHPYDENLAIFNFFLQRADWKRLNTPTDAHNYSVNSPPEATYRFQAYNQQLDLAIHIPIDQCQLSVSDVDGHIDLRVMFFFREHPASLPALLRAISDIGGPITLQNFNRLLVATHKYCQFVLLELPGKGLFEVTPRVSSAI